MSKPIMKASALTRVKIEQIAQTVLKDFCPEMLYKLQPLDVERLYEEYVYKRFGIVTGYRELTIGIHGYTNPARLESAVSSKLIDANDRATIRFCRSTIGHETGHCILHAHQFKKRNEQRQFLHDMYHVAEQRLFRREDLRPYEDPEWQAWEFCKAIFLPRNVLEIEVENGTTVRDISETVNLNPAFVEVRLRNLQLSGKVRAF